MSKNNTVKKVAEFFEIMFMFIHRDLKVAAAYKTSFLIMCSDVIVGTLTWVFLGSSIVYQLGLEAYGGISPFSFIVSGMMLDLLIRYPRRWPSVLSPDSFYSTLIRPTPVWKQAVWFSSFDIFWSSLSLASYLVIGLSFGMPLNANVVSVAIVVALGFTTSLGFGLMEAGVTLIVKRGEPVSWVTFTLTRLLSGQVFPVTVLPILLQNISWVLPQTWTYLLWRLAIFTNAAPFDIVNGILVLTFMSLVLILSGYFLYNKGIEKCKTEGIIT
ncbi:MAG: hypothetical protein ACETV1_00865 [Candidatus Bathyarchaeia archaeon]